MALVDAAFNGLIAAFVTGGITVALFRLSNRSQRKRADDAYTKQAEEIVDYFKTQVADKDAEIRRLNGLLRRRPP